MRIPFSKQYKYFTNHLGLYVTNYYFSVFTVILFMLTMCFSFFNVNPSSNTAFTTIVVCHQISTGPIDLFCNEQSVLFVAEFCICCLIRFSINSHSWEYKLGNLDQELGLWSLSECVFFFFF